MCFPSYVSKLAQAGGYYHYFIKDVTALLEYFDLEWILGARNWLLDNSWQLPECKVDGSMGSVSSHKVIFEKNDNNGHAIQVPRHNSHEEQETTV